MPVRSLAAAAVLLTVAAAGTGAIRRPEPRGRLVLIGTYTGEHSEGILAFRFDDEGGTLEPLGLAAATTNPSFLAIHPNGRWVYAVNEVEDFDEDKGGSVTAFALDASRGRLQEINRQPTRGGAPCYVTLDGSGHALLVANYAGGNVAALPVGADGALGSPTSVGRHQGRSVHPKRQQQPHAHSIRVDPANRFALAADLGIDQVLVYRLDAGRPELKPHDPPSARAAAGAGPRHLAFHPGGRWLYAINELQSTVTVFAWDAAKGTLDSLQTLSTLPPDATGHNTTAEIAVHPSGRFVYGSNRGHDSIVVYAVDERSGRLAPAGHHATRGRTPRHFSLDPSGRWLIAANQDSHSLVIFRVDDRTGSLAPHGDVVRAGAPVCVRFVP